MVLITKGRVVSMESPAFDRRSKLEFFPEDNRSIICFPSNVLGRESGHKHSVRR